MALNLGFGTHWKIVILPHKGGFVKTEVPNNVLLTCYKKVGHPRHVDAGSIIIRWGHHTGLNNQNNAIGQNCQT